MVYGIDVAGPHVHTYGLQGEAVFLPRAVDDDGGAEPVDAE